MRQTSGIIINDDIFINSSHVVKIEKTKKATHNSLKKKLQIGRDKIVAIAETSTVLGEYINDKESMNIL